MRRISVFAILIVLLLVISSSLLLTSTTAAAQPLWRELLASSPTSTSSPQSLPATVNISEFYFHSSGIFSIPRLENWKLKPGDEFTVHPTNSDYIFVGANFYNPYFDSNYYAFTETRVGLRLQTVADLNRFQDKSYFDNAWANFDKYEEKGRQQKADRLIVDFVITLNGKAYTARQISRLAQGWIVTLRVIAPVTLPDLRDQLEALLWPKLNFYPQQAAAPLNWTVYNAATNGLFMKYPADWYGSNNPGEPFVAKGVLRNVPSTLTISTDIGKAVNSGPEAQKWVKAYQPDAKILTTKPETLPTFSVAAAAGKPLTGFSVSFTYNNSDDGKTHSAVASLYNGTNSTLYWNVLDTSIENLDLLSDKATAAVPEIAIMRGTFQVFPLNTYMPTIQPTLRPSPTLSRIISTLPPIPTIFRTPTSTLDPKLFSMDNAKTYKSPDGILQMSVPQGWQTSDFGSTAAHYYAASVGSTAARNRATVTLYVGESVRFYLGLLRLRTNPESPRAALEAYKAANINNANFRLGDIRATKIGSLDAYAMTVLELPSVTVSGSEGQFIFADLPDHRLIAVITSVDLSISAQTRPIIQKITDSLQVNLNALPTLTPTPSNTPLPTATSTPTSTPMASATPIPSATPSHTPTEIPSDTPTVVPSDTPSSTPTSTETSTAATSATATSTASATATDTATYIASATLIPTSTTTPTEVSVSASASQGLQVRR